MHSSPLWRQRLCWRLNWDGAVLFWLLRQHCVAHQERRVSLSTILPKHNQSRLAFSFCIAFDDWFNLRKRKCQLNWLLRKRLHLPQWACDSQLLPPERHIGACQMWTRGQLCRKLFCRGSFALPVGKLYRRLCNAFWPAWNQRDYNRPSIVCDKTRE